MQQSFVLESTEKTRCKNFMSAVRNAGWLAAANSRSSIDSKTCFHRSFCRVMDCPGSGRLSRRSPDIRRRGSECHGSPSGRWRCARSDPAAVGGELGFGQDEAAMQGEVLEWGRIQHRKRSTLGAARGCHCGTIRLPDGVRSIRAPPRIRAELFRKVVLTDSGRNTDGFPTLRCRALLTPVTARCGLAAIPPVSHGATVEMRPSTLCRSRTDLIL